MTRHSISKIKPPLGTKQFYSETVWAESVFFSVDHGSILTRKRLVKLSRALHRKTKLQKSENLPTHPLLVYLCYPHWATIWSNLSLSIICRLNPIWLEYFRKIEKKFSNFSCIHVRTCVCGIYTPLENLCSTTRLRIVHNEVAACVHLYWILCLSSADTLRSILACNHSAVKRKCNIWSFEEEGHKDLQ